LEASPSVHLFSCSNSAVYYKRQHAYIQDRSAPGFKLGEFNFQKLKKMRKLESLLENAAF